MAFVRIHRIIANPGSGATGDYVFGTRGGILLNIALSWKPRQFYNIGTIDEQVVPGDMHAFIGDQANSLLILGQDSSGMIVVPTFGSWGWTNPMRQEIMDGSQLISKLAFHNFTPMPIGVIQGQLRVIVGWDPLKLQSHDVIVEAELLAFDSAII